jgi:adenylylsulfate reductase subunit A
MQALRFMEDGALEAGPGPGGAPRETAVQIEGTEPDIIGGHTASGYQVDASRATTLPGLYACGDAAGGAPQKYVSGAIAEGFIAAEAIADGPGAAGSAAPGPGDRLLEALARLSGGPAPAFSSPDLEEAMQKSMDLYAGGRSAGYRYGLAGLREAERRVVGLWRLAWELRPDGTRGLSRAWELFERLTVARSLVHHLAERRETRWPGFGEYAGHPEADDAYLVIINSRLEDPPVAPPADLEGRPPVMLRRSLADGRELTGPAPSVLAGGEVRPCL